jgi:hypothetical protein
MDRWVGRRLFTVGLERDVFEDDGGGSTSSVPRGSRCTVNGCR